MISAATYPLRLVRRLLNLVFTESLYMMWVPEYGYAHKFKYGRSAGVKNRCREIRAQTRLNVRVLVWLPVPSVKRVEAALLAATARLRTADIPDHSGKSEWRKWFNGVTAVLVWFFLPSKDAGFYAVTVLLFPIPFDGLLFWLVTVIVTYTLFAAGIYAAGWLIFKII